MTLFYLNAKNTLIGCLVHTREEDEGIKDFREEVVRFASKCLHNAGYRIKGQYNEDQCQY